MSQKAECDVEVCPELQDPGRTGCLVGPVLDRVVKLEKLETALNGPEGHPELGFIWKAETFFANAASASKEKWTRMEKSIAEKRECQFGTGVYCTHEVPPIRRSWNKSRSKVR